MLEKIVAAAADPTTGEFMVPLAPDRVESLRAALRERLDQVDEGVLTNAFAWMRKASQEKLDGMVVILQRMLQLYAAEVLPRSVKWEGQEGEAVRKTLGSQQEEWAGVLEGVRDGGSPDLYMKELQKCMEQVVLGLDNGSVNQRVQAEYLKEVEKTAKEVFGIEAKA